MNELTPYGMGTEIVESKEMDFAGELIGTGKPSFCSMKAETVEQKKLLFNATNKPDSALKEHVNRTIRLKDVFVESVDIRKEDGTVTTCPRSVLIDVNGKSYSATSIGVFGALKKLFQAFGLPTYEKGIDIEIQQISKNNRNITTFVVK